MNKPVWLAFLDIFAIVIMISACVIVYKEAKVCHDPLKILLEMSLENTGNIDLNYSYVVINFYDGRSAIATQSWKISYDGNYLPMETATQNKKYTFDFNESMFEELIAEEE